MESQGLLYQPRTPLTSLQAAISSDKITCRFLEGTSCQWSYLAIVKHVILLACQTRCAHRCNCGVTTMGATNDLQIKFKAYSTVDTVFGTVNQGKNHGWGYDRHPDGVLRSSAL